VRGGRPKKRSAEDAQIERPKALRGRNGEGVTSSGGSRKNYWGAWPLIIWEATTAKRNY